MAIDFPSSPAVGQRYAYAGINYIFTAQGVWATTSVGAPAISTSNISAQIFTASGSYVPTPGTQFAVIECIGGGGGGGGAWTNTAGQYMGGGGGGSGGYSRKYATAAQLGASQTVTIGPAGAGGIATPAPGGAGGDTNVGGLCIAKGGAGGLPTRADGAILGNGGAGGSIAGAVGDVVFAGSPGGNGSYIGTGAVGWSGPGGSSAFGGGAVGQLLNSTVSSGINASNYGSGGSGGEAAAAVGIAAGGAGSAGIVIITEYNIAAAGPQGPVGPQGGTTGVAPPQGRLTLQAATPVMVVSSAGQTTLRYTPYVGDKAPIYDGSVFTMTTFTELSCGTTDASKNPAPIGANKTNDWFVWNDSGVIRLGHGPDWVTDTTRSLAIARVNGIWVNNSAITNGPAAQRGTYVGTTRSNASSSLDWVLGSAALGGGAALLNVWNCYNRVNVTTTVIDSTSNWTMGATSRPFNNSINNRVSAVFGLAEDMIYADVSATIYTPTNWGQVGIGFDDINALSGMRAGAQVGAGWSLHRGSFATTAVGFHFWQWIEATVVGDCQVGGNFPAIGTVSAFDFRARM